MGTDIYGVIEVREPFNAAWPDRERPWMPCMRLYPVFPGDGYDGFGCLFGERNWAGWTPVAAGRGLPADVSESVRRDYRESADADPATHGSTWISWPELRDLDMTARLPARGILGFGDDPPAGIWTRQRVDDRWPDECLAARGLPPISGSPAGTPYGTWRRGRTTFRYEPAPSRYDVLGPGTGWEHVFAVMRTLAGRFGAEGVRLVAWFD